MPSSSFPDLSFFYGILFFGAKEMTIDIEFPRPN